MSRVIALSIVLCVTAGQDAVAICRAWCGTQDAGATACGEHETPGAAVRSHDHCNDLVPAIATTLPAHGQPVVGGGLVPAALPPPVDRTPGSRLVREYAQPPPLHRHSPPVSLRI